ncbi:(deoxy)nucleoside triphosphate pyrophosphohydrolase [Alkalihalophilus marmarensis]|uniref:(deoxy)nucleoside triphosphate pyrophosphohydrolase n=1 Tax=Alkalihalophilus marmarensis TaxID=521377 RepID=UPI002DB65AC8|nr:(deoxy)nucleoside triphosphate pyrophosphohydrolase [Alkalihalophilus marmarensis]MEC2072490.1 (deoxy)nucleoside triphosphate pyrophosphohydrolase [Alkalihalophilus marmarensis]
MKRIAVVAAVIEDKDNRIMCALRSPSMSLPNYWEFPGGKVEEKENHEGALIREIREELQVDIAVNKPIIDVRHTYDDVEVHLYTYWCSIVSGKPRAREHAELRWVPRNKLDELTWAPADIPTVEIIKEKKD